MGKIIIAVKSKAPVERLYELGRDTYKFAHALPNIKTIKVIEESPDRSFSRAEWILALKLPGRDGKLSWIKDTYWDNETMTCRFNISPLYDGVVTKLDGTWSFSPAPHGSEMRMKIDFLVEHALVNPLVHRIFDGIMRKNNLALLEGIRKRAEAPLI